MDDHELDSPCPDDALMAAVELAQADDAQGLARVGALLGHHPGDARLHFLLGSLLAGVGRYGEARAAMSDAVRIAPGYDLARFQLGLLELSSGEPLAAEASLAPLHALAPDNPLRLFAEGLGHLMRDEFAEARERLGEGIARNVANPAMNTDMQRIIEGMPTEPAGQAKPIDAEEEPISAAHLLLRHYQPKPTRH